jgi:21S rRNA (GM2251-2'-O)-methyltransferase
MGGRYNFLAHLQMSMFNFPRCRQIVGASLSDSAVRVDEVDRKQPTVLVLGNEGHGIRSMVLKQCNKLIKIEGTGGSSGKTERADLDSLNVSVSGGILLYALLKTV